MATSGHVLAVAGLFGDNVTGLIPATTYHFRAKADGGAFGLSYGPDITFTTAAIPSTTTTTTSTVPASTSTTIITTTTTTITGATTTTSIPATSTTAVTTPVPTSTATLPTSIPPNESTNGNNTWVVIAGIIVVIIGAGAVIWYLKTRKE